MSSNQQYDDSAYDPQQGSDPYLDDQHQSHDDGDQQHHDGQQDKSSGIHHEEGKMFIGGLNWETTDESLREYFSKFGDVTDCVVMKEPGTGKSRGFGFLTFVDPSVVDNVLKQEHHLDGKMIDPKRAIPREEQDKTEKIFVGGIAPEVTEDEFKDYFGQFGHVIDATLMTDRETGRPRGFGFITFESDKGVEEAMKRTDLAIRDKQIEVKKAMPKHKAQQARMMQGMSTMSMSNLPSSSISMSGSLPSSSMSSLGYDPRTAAYAAAAIGRSYGASTPNSRYQGAAAYGVAANGKNSMATTAGYDSRYAAYSGYSGYSGYGYNGYGSYSDYSRRGYDPTTMAAYYGRGYGYNGYGTGSGTGWGTSIGTGSGRGSYGYGGGMASGRSSGYDGYSGTSGYGVSAGTASGAASGTYARGYGREDGGYGQTATTGSGGGEFAGNGRTDVYDRRVSGGGAGGATRTATSPGASGAGDRAERGAGRSGSSGPSSGVARGTTGFQGTNGNGGGGAIYTSQAVRNQHSYHPYR